ncbi:hypothetical protein C7474_2194 [Microbacterium telephonicum]|uniref:Ribbon-helix-helix CopG family protein n=2 Tax=Microbacterium telephonicum TaxID=1714841 RepID=A0A498BW26_9MICO|nr:hypothetical protein C7474_2194 [Microbacterium telephonicum]
MNTGTLEPMPNKPRTKIRGVRVPDELWEDAQKIAKARGEDVSAEIRAGLERYVKRNRNLLD